MSNVSESKFPIISYLCGPIDLFRSNLVVWQIYIHLMGQQIYVKWVNLWYSECLYIIYYDQLADVSLLILYYFNIWLMDTDYSRIDHNYIRNLFGLILVLFFRKYGNSCSLYITDCIWYIYISVFLILFLGVCLYSFGLCVLFICPPCFSFVYSCYYCIPIYIR